MSKIYPSIRDEEFNSKIAKKYKKYKIPKKKKTFRQICYPKEFNLQIPQQFLGQYINPKTPYKGVLIFHRIGAGKTCTAVNIAEQWKHKRKIVVVVPASLIGNFKAELRSPCAKSTYLTKRERERLSRYHPSMPEYKEIIKISDKRINKYYSIYSYNKFVDLAEEGSMNLRNSVLIVDEVQNMVSEKGRYYQVLYNTIKNAPASLRIVLLSATPMFDKPHEIALTMNLLPLPYELPIGREFDLTFLDKRVGRGGKEIVTAKNMDIFKERINGFVSYYRGAPPHVFPESIVKFVKCEMSDYQYKSYLGVLSKELKKSNRRGFTKGSILKLPNNFFIGTRIISNIAFPNRLINERGYKAFCGKHLKPKNLGIYSTKFKRILIKIKNSTGPVFVYSNFKEYGGIKSFVKVLEGNGYKDYTKEGEGYHRFAVWSGDQTNDTREEIKEVFNQPGNYNGSKIKVILGTPSMKEGVSLKNVRQVHILEVYWNWSRMLQIIGRAVRYCSHKQLPEEKRDVRVYIYLATHPKEKQTIDQYIAGLALKKNKLINEFELALKEVAVDCELFKNGNVFKGEEKIKCGI